MGSEQPSAGITIPAEPKGAGEGADSASKRAVRVTGIQWKAATVRTIELCPLEPEPLPSFTPGAHINLHLPTGLVRSYSLLGDPADRARYVVGVARDRASRGGSIFIHDQLRVGDTLRVDGPRNLFRLDSSDAPAVLIGGGIGITPLITMAAELARRGRDWRLHYAVRSVTEAAFMPDLARHGGRVHLHSDDAAGGVLPIAQIVASASSETHFYCCGPAPMLDVFAAATHDMAAERIHIERFTPAETAATGGGYLVELARSGRTIAVPSGSTILEALIQAGIDYPHSCQQGICGTCETGVIAGIPDHRDAVLTDSEHAANTSMMICCSGSLSEKLVLDI